MRPQTQQIAHKLDDLSPERLTEVEDFIDFLRARDRDKALLREYAQASEAAFAKVWDNEEDDSAYRSEAVLPASDLSQVAGLFKGRTGPKTDQEIEAGLLRDVQRKWHGRD